jgi:mannose-6-phosphate isomerase-like protein (cupin superfamily)
MLSFLRGAQPARRNTATHNPVYYENNATWQEFHPVGSEYFTTHHVGTNKSFFNPPTHLHLYQSEVFSVRQGSGHWYLPTATTPEKRKTTLRIGDSIHLPKGKFHRWENASDTEPLEVDIRIEPPTAPWGVEEDFFRNFFGYIEDCNRAGLKPSFFQVQLFVHVIEGPLAVPIPGPDWLKWWASKLFCLVTGVIIGEWLLGYKRSYPEYYQPPAPQPDSKTK